MFVQQANDKRFKVRNAFTVSGIVEDLAEVVIIAVLGDFHDQVYFKKNLSMCCSTKLWSYPRPFLQILGQSTATQ